MYDFLTDIQNKDTIIGNIDGYYRPNLTVYKYPFAVDTNRFSIDMPDSARLLSCQIQNGSPCFWAAVDPKSPMRQRNFAVVETGESVPLPSQFVGTLQVGPFAYHVFEI